MYPGYWDDYNNDGEPTKQNDKIVPIFKVISPNGNVTEGKAALSKLMLLLGYTGKKQKHIKKVTFLKEKGYMIMMRKQNITTKQWIDPDFKTL
jgi:hypothetical protein